MAFLQFVAQIYSLWIFKFHIIASFHMINDDLALKQYTFYYESYHYDIPNWSLLENDSISIVDDYNNTITFNSSLILSINDNIIIDYAHNYQFNEIQIIKEIAPNTDNNRRRLRRRRRGSRKWRSRRNRRRRKKRKKKKTRHRRRKRPKKQKKKKKTRKSRRQRRRKQRSAVSRWVQRWKKRTQRKMSHNKRKKKHRKKKYRKNRYAEQGRFVGYFKGSRRGSTFSGAHKYCKRKYGELASIGNKVENEKAKRVCRVILGDDRHNGYYCWIGLHKPYKKWTDNRNVEFRHYSPNQKHLDHHGRYTGTDKCVSLYKRSGAWYHQRCNYRNGVICSKPRGIYVDDFIVIQKQYRYDKAKKVCQQWYGTDLATIHNDEQNRNARRACISVADSGHCWIGMERPFKSWDDGIAVKYTNWAKGEPNNLKKEGCVEIYPSAKWNNIPCRVHRYPVCNGKTLFERMEPKLRKYIVKKQYMQFREDWLKHQEQAWMLKKKRGNSFNSKVKAMMLHKMGQRMHERYKDDLSTKFFNSRYGLSREKKLGYQPLLTKQMLYGMYHQKYGRFPAVKDPPWMSYWLKRLKRKVKNGRNVRRQTAPVQEYQFSDGAHLHHIYGDLDHKPYDGRQRTLSLGGLDGMNRELKMRSNRAMGTGQFKPISLQLRRRLKVREEHRKCVLLGNVDGLQELCIGSDYIEVKRYVERVRKELDVGEIVMVDYEYGGIEISNASDIGVDYVDFENWKYRKGIFMAGNAKDSAYKYGLQWIGNVEDEIYYAERYEFMTDLKSGQRECWSFVAMREALNLCVSVADSEDEIAFHVAKGNDDNESVWHSFVDDSNWDEVTVNVDDGGISKCTHLFEMKICVHVDFDKETNGLEINEVDVLTLHDEDDDDNHIFF